jgi:hypothetical protein
MDPSNVFAMDDVAFMTGYLGGPVASETAVGEAIQKYYGSTRSSSEDRADRRADSLGRGHGLGRPSEVDSTPWRMLRRTRPRRGRLRLHVLSQTSDPQKRAPSISRAA